MIRMYFVVAWIFCLCAALANAGCQRQCGNVVIPYPFGISNGGGGDDGCFRGPAFNLTCNDNFLPPKPFWGGLEVINISVLLAEMTIGSIIRVDCYNSSISINKSANSHGYLNLAPDEPFTFSQSNRFTTIGCGHSSVLRGHWGHETINACGTVCSNVSSQLKDGACDGVGCCQVSIPKGVKKFDIYLGRYSDDMLSSYPCGFAFLVDQDQFHFKTSMLSNYRFSNGKVPVVLDWAINNKTCDSVQNSDDYACRGQNTKCIDAKIEPGYLCSCKDGFAGNPYEGCSDINECADKTQNKCKHACHNEPGSYRCSCPHGMVGDGREDGSGCKLPVTQLVVGINSIILILVIVATLFYWHYQKNKLEKLKAEYFYQNGGAIYNSLSSRGAVDIVKVYHEDELKKATNNYSEIIGEGGYGVVYKGHLPPYGEVAVKKSKIVDKNQVEDFINEISALYRMNHKNVVKLLGCCLESKSPILVYEFISNGTLAQRLHQRDFVGSISFRNRLKIAIETAGALAYLHSDVSVPIIHGDVKSANILLDSNLNAKVSDFGTSKLVPSDQQGQIETIVKGTPGYLDPEYLQTCQLTKKSDVYSFGVVLVELLTGEIPISNRGPQRKSLVRHFISELRENRLSDALEERVRIEGLNAQVMAVGHLAERCLRVKGEDRPTMRDVATELQQLIRWCTEHPWVPKNLDEKETLLGPSWEECSNSATGEVTAEKWVSLEIEMALGR